MLKQYFQQAWYHLKQNPVLSFITILGTVLSITMIMILVMADRIRYGNIAPENTRDRTLYVKNVRVESKTDEAWSSNSQLGLKLIKDLFVPLQSPQALYFYTEDYHYARETGTDINHNILVQFNNGNNWKVFDYSFVSGHPFGTDEVDAGAKVAVISDQTARKLFDTEDAVGKSFVLNNEETFEVVGVVRKPSNLTDYANGSIWIPYTASLLVDTDNQSLVDTYKLVILAEKRSDLSKIKAEVAATVQRFNDTNPNYVIKFRGQPDSHRSSVNRVYNNAGSEVNEYNRKQIMLLLLFLLVPAINLSLMTTSRMKQKATEIGIRRTYGATTYDIASQVIWESLLFTIIGSLIGFLLSFGAFFMLRKILFKGYAVTGMQLSLIDLMRPEIFLYAVLFCLLLNLIASIVPAIKSSKSNIINNLYQA